MRGQYLSWPIGSQKREVEDRLCLPGWCTRECPPSNHHGSTRSTTLKKYRWNIKTPLTLENISKVFLQIYEQVIIVIENMQNIPVKQNPVSDISTFHENIVHSRNCTEKSISFMSFSQKLRNIANYSCHSIPIFQ